MGASILIGYILLYTGVAAESIDGYTVIENIQFDMVNGGKPILYATREECHAALKELVYERSEQHTYTVELQKNGDLVAESEGIENKFAFSNKVICFEIWDAVGKR
jgi:hypothetical protein